MFHLTGCGSHLVPCEIAVQVKKHCLATLAQLWKQAFSIPMGRKGIQWNKRSQAIRKSRFINVDLVASAASLLFPPHVIFWNTAWYFQDANIDNLMHMFLTNASNVRQMHRTLTNVSIKQVSANYGLWVPPVSENNVLLEDSHAHPFTYRLWLLCGRVD